VARALDAVTTDFVGCYAGLGEGELSALCFHRRGNRPVGWYAMHRLAELAFHSWDLQVSLGREPELSEPVAAMLLETLLESNAPRTYAAESTTQRGTGERYLFDVAGDASSRWLVTIDPEQLATRRAAAAADLAITGSAADLDLVVYGRRELSDLARSGEVRLEGAPEFVDRFALVFPRP
jgi:hypothetical protein